MVDGYKLPPFLILQGVRPPAPRDIPPEIKVCMTQNGWMNEAACHRWVQVWPSCTEDGHCRLLVWDAFRVHNMPEIKELLSDREVGNSDVATIPGRCTSLLQPADLSWNTPFQDHLREKWDAWMINGPHTFTKGNNMCQPTIAEMLTWTAEAWEKVTTNTVVRSFKKPGISNAMDGTKDDMLWLDEDDEDMKNSLFLASLARKLNRKKVLLQLSKTWWKKTMMKSTGSPMTPMERTRSSLAISGVEFIK